MSRFERGSIWVTALLMTLTGTGYLWMKYFMEPADPWAVVSHPLEPWLLRAHVVVAPFFVFAAGMITATHVWRHLRTGVRWARTSGLVSLAALAAMVLSGYLIQVVTAEGWIEAMVIVHLVTGYLFMAALAVHEWKTRAPPGADAAVRRRRSWPAAERPAARWPSPRSGRGQETTETRPGGGTA